jgi:tetrathionate reductase subunit B
MTLDSNPVRQTADKCDFCVSRIDQGLQPACVEACVSGALIFGDLDDPSSEIYRTLASTGATVLKEGLGTRPKVFYVAADAALMGRIQYSPNWKEGILQYHEHIVSPDASYWKKGR